MALTRKFLREKGIEDETVIQEIIDAHMETVTPLKAYKSESERLTGELADAQAQLTAANQRLEAAGQDDYKAKYDALVQENQQKEVRTAKETALRGLLDELGISEKGKGLALKYTDLDTVELDPAGKLANGAAVKEAVLADWGDYKGTVTEKGANVSTPPGGGGGNVMSMDDIYKMENGKYKLTPAQRQAELAKLRESQTQKG